MQLVLFILPLLAGYAGYTAWPLYAISVIGAASGIWNLMYFGVAPLQLANGGPLAYMFRISIINTVQATIFYGLGLGLKIGAQLSDASEWRAD